MSRPADRPDTGWRSDRHGAPEQPGPPSWLRGLAQGAVRLGTDEMPWVLPPPPETARPSAVLALFGRTGAEIDLVLIERAHDMRAHAGQLAFPGGASDEGESAVEAALREAEEEIGLDPTGVEVLGELPVLWLPPTNFAVTTVLAWWRTESAVGVVDPQEVAGVLRVPVAELVDPAHRVTVVHPLGHRGPGFRVGDLVLWGFTAGVVDMLLRHAGLVREWDSARTVPAPVSASEDGR